MAVLDPEQEVELVAETLVAAIPGVDVDGDPRDAGGGIVVVRAAGVDAVVGLETEAVSPYVAIDPDRHIIVEVNDAHGPGVMVEDCNSSGGCAIVDVRVEAGVQEVADACAGSNEEVV